MIAHAGDSSRSPRLINVNASEPPCPSPGCAFSIRFHYQRQTHSNETQHVRSQPESPDRNGSKFEALAQQAAMAVSAPQIDQQNVTGSSKVANMTQKMYPPREEAQTGPGFSRLRRKPT